ncbi:MAG TPA: EAL domain-containing protein, partial [Acidimicrobiales bacterium]|nr:EAL domain-containing protein [Acidimicrobiales bacterium]
RSLRRPRDPADPRLLDHGAFVGVGIVGPEDPPTEADALVHGAGLALEEARRAGRGNHLVVFDNRLRERITSEFSRDQAIRRALQAEDFSLHYQPIVDAESGDVHGYEALLRWRRPGGELEGPVEVIAVAEETGEIAALGSFVRRRALADFGALLAHSPELFLCINLSPYELEHQGLAAEVEELCRAAGVAPAQLCFELTESALVTASDDFWRFQQLLDLKRIGVRLAIDDFGTGYSALSYLKKLPVDVVKIDRSFVADLATSEADTVLVEAITRLAHALGLSVVAEGVETEMELQILKTLGVDRAQGYLLGRPAPPHDASERVPSP